MSEDNKASLEILKGKTIQIVRFTPAQTMQQKKKKVINARTTMQKLLILHLGLPGEVSQ